MARPGERRARLAHAVAGRDGDDRGRKHARGGRRRRASSPEAVRDAERFLGLLVRAVALRPRPRHAGDGEIVLPVPLMARLLGGASSEAEPAAAERLSAIAAHWRIELIGSAGWYLEVVDSERGLWSVEDRPGAAVALVPTDPTAVLDQLAALPGHAGLG